MDVEAGGALENGAVSSAGCVQKKEYIYYKVVAVPAEWKDHFKNSG